MSNLAVSGMASLHALNQWISVIDTNLTNTKRIGYKETRVSMTGGIPDSLGTVNSVGKPRNIDIPSATLNIANTEIMDKIQGNLTPTESNTDFALDGQGYFVVEDKFGQRYATRDGQFHFDNDGYLITQQGLKVLSAGQDWIRVPISEHFLVDNNGRSTSTTDVNGLSTSLYGNKKLMVVRLPENKKLYYSQYGFTTFEMGKFLPIDLNNNFLTTMDGLNPDEIQTFTSSAFTNTVSSSEKLFKRDVKNGGVDVNISQGRAAQALVSSHKFVDFANEFSFTMATPDDFSTIGFTFGLQDQDLKIPNPAAPFAGHRGLGAGIIKSATGVHYLTFVDQYGSAVGPLSLIPNLIQSTYNVPNGANLDTDIYEYKISLIVEDGKANLSLNTIHKTKSVNAVSGSVVSSSSTSVGTIALPSYTLPSYVDGYQSVGTLNTGFNLNGGSLASTSVNAKMKITNLNVKQLGGSTYFDMNMVGTKRSNEFDSAGGKYNTQYTVVDPDSQENIDTQVKQQYVEESTTTVADTIPLLSNTQKMFSAISKIINVANTLSDDVNTLIR